MQINFPVKMRDQVRSIKIKIGWAEMAHTFIPGGRGMWMLGIELRTSEIAISAHNR
jgi:hypothetical protein